MTNVKAINSSDGMVHRSLRQLWEGLFRAKHAPQNMGAYLKYNIDFKAVSVISDPSGNPVTKL
jgi:hypothetical protein